MISTFSKSYKQTQKCILCPQVPEYEVMIPTICKDPHSRVDCVDKFIQVVNETEMKHIVPVGAIVGPAHFVQENAASSRIDSIWLVNNHVDIDTCWTVNYVPIPESSCAGGR
jgi:hypothetical protein